MRELLRRLGQFLSTLGINFVPAGGWFFGGWSAGTLLGVYWFENVAASLLVALRIMIQCRLAPRRGHFYYRVRGQVAKGGGSLLSYFLPTSLIFSAAHGLFLAVIFFILSAKGHGAEVQINFPELLRGCGLVQALLIAIFLIDLWNLRRQPFAWIERLTAVNLSRVVLVHLAIIFGIAVAAFTGVNTAFFSVFIVLKTMSDFSGLLPQWNPKVPSAWLCRLMDKLPNPRRNQGFAEYCAEDRKAEETRRARNEEPA